MLISLNLVLEVEDPEMLPGISTKLRDVMIVAMMEEQTVDMYKDDDNITLVHHEVHVSDKPKMVWESEGFR